MLPHFPKYSELKAFLKVLSEIEANKLKNLFKTINQLLGTPQNPFKWDNPDEWINDRLSGEDNEIARKMWFGSNRIVNPRYAQRDYWPVKTYNLANENSKGVFSLNSEGEQFLINDLDEITYMMDKGEGLIFILNLILSNGAMSPKEMDQDWSSYCLENSNLRNKDVMRSYLRSRLANLLERELLQRVNGRYSISPIGKQYLNKFNNPGDLNPIDKLLRLASEIKKKQKEELRKKLESMNPYAFEVVVRDLLEAMGYDDVEVTSQSNDKGIDVKGTVQIGITSIVEVVQVKRVKSNITRPVLDMLRGSLYRFNALRGTIITLSDFAKGARDASMELGAAPITLINGERLIELLIEYEIGIKRKELNYYIIDDKWLKGIISEPEIE